MSLRGGPVAGPTKQSSDFDAHKVVGTSSGWIATARFAGLAMTNKNECR
jgi:hypothetical protein